MPRIITLLANAFTDQPERHWTSGVSMPCLIWAGQTVRGCTVVSRLMHSHLVLVLRNLSFLNLDWLSVQELSSLAPTVLFLLNEIQKRKE